MRSSKKRSRSNQNRPRSLGNIVNRVFDSSGPEGKVRGTPQQIIEKYLALARDAQLSNDRVAAENFLQHAEHYTRLLAEAQRELAAEQEARQQLYQQQAREREQRGDRGEQRPPPEPREPAPAGGMPEVIDFGRADAAGLVELPEAREPADLPDDAPASVPPGEDNRPPATPARRSQHDPRRGPKPAKPAEKDETRAPAFHASARRPGGPADAVPPEPDSPGRSQENIAAGDDGGDTAPGVKETAAKESGPRPRRSPSTAPRTPRKPRSSASALAGEGGNPTGQTA